MDIFLAAAAANAAGVKRKLSGVDCVRDRVWILGMIDCGYAGGGR